MEIVIKNIKSFKYFILNIYMSQINWRINPIVFNFTFFNIIINVPINAKANIIKFINELKLNASLNNKLEFKTNPEIITNPFGKSNLLGKTIIKKLIISNIFKIFISYFILITII
jgi:hypothetical protein